ncbi:MAG: MMPL family transporter [Deltaproteobacteria bacterium]|nr:MMPL family transporter [Deltaproteobacteria bacterium]
MDLLARLIANRAAAVWIVVVTVGLGVASAFQATRLQQSDDLLEFLPRGNLAVAKFTELSRRFGTTEIALVGIETDDPFAASFLKRLQQATEELKGLGSLNHVLSLANTGDFTPDPGRGGVVTTALVDRLPANAVDEQALRTKVMSRDQVVGNLVAADGRAVAIVAMLAAGAPLRAVAAQIQAVVTKAFPTETLYWAGDPFVSTYVFNTTQHDLLLLTPWAVLAVILILMVTFRDPVGISIVLVATTLSIAMTLGLMAALGVRFNIVLAGMPVVLFAIGSAYGVHLLARYYALNERLEPTTSLTQAIHQTGPVIIGSGLTTVVSLASYLGMDVHPLRIFGLFAGVGIFLAMGLSLTFVPALASLLKVHHHPSSSTAVAAAIGRLTRGAARHRLGLGAALALVAVLGAAASTRLDSSVDAGAFFNAGSPPALAEAFMRAHFGGSQFAFIEISGDMREPANLRLVRRIADRAALEPGVTGVSHIGQAVATANAVLAGQARIPETAAQVSVLYSFMGDPVLDQFVTRDHAHSLIHIRLASDRAAEVAPVLARLDAIASEAGATGAGSNPAGDVAWRVLALAHQHHLTVSASPERLQALIDHGTPRPDVAVVEAELRRFLGSEENAVVLPDAEAARVASALVTLGDRTAVAELTTTVAASLSPTRPPSDAEDLALSVSTPLRETWAVARAAWRRDQLVSTLGLAAPATDAVGRFAADVTQAMLDLEDGATAAGGAAPVAIAVNGLPVMHRGLSQSVSRNQIVSLIASAALVLLIMAALFRSLWVGLLALTPTVLTLLCVYGAMGVFGIRLDVGTSMLASLVIGAGVDYAIHLLASWRAPPGGSAADAAHDAGCAAGPGVWTNAVMVAAGFSVLTLGDAKPLQNIGGLTAASMLLAALATFLAVPALAGRRRYEILGATRATAADSAAAVVLDPRTTAAHKPAPRK